MSTSKKKRKLQLSEEGDNQPPTKKRRHNDKQAPKCPNPYIPSQTNGTGTSKEYVDTFPTKQAPQCPNPYIPSKRYPSHYSQTNGTSKEYGDTLSNKPKRPTPTKKHLHSQNIRKKVPYLRSSQESLPPITRSTPIRENVSPRRRIRNTKAVYTANTTTTTKDTPSSPHNAKAAAVKLQIQIQKAAKLGRYPQKTHRKTVIENKAQNTFACNFMDFKRAFSERGWFVVLIAFVVGFLLCSAAMPIAFPHTDEAKTTNTKYIDDNKSCMCDVKTNKTSIECQDCMDKYWEMYEIHTYTECTYTEELESEIHEMRQKTNGFNKCAEAEKELRECKVKNGELTQEIINIRPNSQCVEELDKIRELEHNLGECNVEWESCEMLGRQKDELDKKRLAEIGKHKHKFSLCNQQLKRYKEKAKQNKGNQ